VITTGEPRGISNVAWHAVLKKDRHYDGKFLYAAVTTRIYCRPSCPARNPHRRNALIFLTVAEAERQGYVACLRCHPNSLTPAEKSIKVTLDYIEAHLDQTITLNTLSLVSGLSPHHLQQTFKRIVGLSPKAFCSARRIARFKQFLRADESIASACYGVGYGSSRTLYETSSKGLGMTPRDYRRGGEGIRIRYTISDSVLGRILLSGTEEGICAVLLGEEDAVLIRELREEFPKAVFRSEKFSQWTTAVQSCQSVDPMLAKLPMSLRGRVFQARVWNSLQ